MKKNLSIFAFAFLLAINLIPAHRAKANVDPKCKTVGGATCSYVWCSGTFGWNGCGSGTGTECTSEKKCS